MPQLSRFTHKAFILGLENSSDINLDQVQDVWVTNMRGRSLVTLGALILFEWGFLSSILLVCQGSGSQTSNSRTQYSVIGKRRHSRKLPPNNFNRPKGPSHNSPPGCSSHDLSSRSASAHHRHKLQSAKVLCFFEGRPARPGSQGYYTHRESSRVPRHELFKTKENGQNLRCVYPFSKLPQQETQQ